MGCIWTVFCGHDIMKRVFSAFGFSCSVLFLYQIYEIFSISIPKISERGNRKWCNLWRAEFIYLGTLISNDNSVEKEIQRHILASNRTYIAVISLFRSRLLSRVTKIILYKTLIRPVVSYGAEAWTLTKKEEQVLLLFERKIFRRIYGPKCENRE